MNTKKRFGLVGKNISYSFSKAYFSKKFEKLALHNHSYENFDLENIQDFPEIFKGDSAGLIGLNVTIPYKEKVAEYLDAIDEDAATIGAINTFKMEASGRKVGYNTDVYGFKNSLLPLLQPHHKKALILGTGGASKAVAFAFDQLGISYVFVSRTPSLGQLSYKDVECRTDGEHITFLSIAPLSGLLRIRHCVLRFLMHL
jgi:shikimate dehydrogenase